MLAGRLRQIHGRYRRLGIALLAFVLAGLVWAGEADGAEQCALAVGQMAVPFEMRCALRMVVMLVIAWS
jgi:hypothetical protein